MMRTRIGMRLWDLDSELLFPKQTVVAYVKNVLHLSGSSLDVRGLISTHSLYHKLKAVTKDGQDAELIAPYATGGVRRMYIPFVFQRSFMKPDFRWSSDGRRTEGCFRVGMQRDGEDFWLVTSRSAVIRYARSGKPRDFRDGETYHHRVNEFIEKSLDDDWIQEMFRFADIDGVTTVVPFLPIVLNQAIQTEIRNGRPALPDYTKKGWPARR
jgi:hypothetical protein